MVLALGLSTAALADELLVASNSEFSTALAAAESGDVIRLAPGVYSGGFSRSGLSGVTITSVNPEQPAVFQGGSFGLQLSDATSVTLEHLIFEGQTGNGLNIDDGGSYETPSTDITLRHLTVRDMQQGGNFDGIKLSGVTGFMIDRVLVENWGSGGSAIDPVGSHNGVIQNSIFRHASGASSGVRPKGGSKNIAIYANRFEMGAGEGRAIQAGGSTGPEYFRFIDGDSDYEAANIVAAGNIVVGALAPVSWVNIDGGVFHHNWLQNTGKWTMRILNENAGNNIVDTQNGVLVDNVIEYDSTAGWSRAANVGAETLPDTFTFARNQWQNAGGATNIDLPTTEIDGVYGAINVPRVGDQIRWDFPWGHWVVNASPNQANEAMEIAGSPNLLVATPGENAHFDPLAADPLTGDWSFTPLENNEVTLSPQSQMILVLPGVSSAIPQLPGDYDRNAVVDAEDYRLWKQQFGHTGTPLADGNGSGIVDLADYTIWRDQLAVASRLPGDSQMHSVPEPSSIACTAMCVAVYLVMAR
ncbi:right-handed parallel beta-helix repeat-containing protein [Aeoliella mucimassa]|uniref:right-handed parallel beta-helix repeat-containing protein n=1 Tax=Aeoliella mucimassa TaxID=2527972 RepID=UPI00119D16EC|nr:right-handed parallel beta-helix repeat-containing protein [Aeoliella mucimassa]